MAVLFPLLPIALSSGMTYTGPGFAVFDEVCGIKGTRTFHKGKFSD